MDRNNFGATNKLLRNWGACVDTVFLTRVKKSDIVKEKVADLEETKRCTGSGPADGVGPMGQKNIP
jgi:hypothetical protein